MYKTGEAVVFDTRKVMATAMLNRTTSAVDRRLRQNRQGLDLDDHAARKCNSHYS